MEKETLQQTVDRLKNFEGNVKGEVFRTYSEYIKQKEGEDGPRKVEERMKELGVPIKFDGIKSFEWISEGMSSLTIVVAKDIFNWSEDDVFEMGRFAPKVSFIIKMMIQYITSVDAVLENAENYWKKHFDFGSLEAEHKKENNQIFIREKGYKTHPLMCLYHAGYYLAICELSIKGENIKIKETACAHTGKDYHEYLVTWE